MNNLQERPAAAPREIWAAEPNWQSSSPFRGSTAQASSAKTEFSRAKSMRFALYRLLDRKISLFIAGKSVAFVVPSCPARGALRDRHERWDGMRWPRQRRRVTSMAGQACL